MLRFWPALLMLAGAAQAATFNFNGGGVVPTCPLVGTTYNCTSLPNSSDTDRIVIADGYTVTVASSVAFSYNQGLQMSGTAKLQASGSLNIADVNPSNLSVSGGTLAAGTNFKIGNQAQTIVANVTAATMTIGSGSNTKITGSLTATGQIDLGSHATIVGPVAATVVTTNSPVVITGAVNASTSFQLASGSTLTGSLTSPKVTLDPSSVTVTGNISASTSISIGSGNTVNGAIAGGSLNMASSNVTVNGNVTMTGDVSIGSSGTINGDLVARNVTTQSSGDYISGNAAVNAIYLDYGARVGKTITCTGAPPGAAPCSCVTRADSNYQPTCGAPPPAAGPHHIQISHNGTALTCQPQTVSLIACANDSCTAPHYSANFSGSLSPGNLPFTIQNGTGSGLVQQTNTNTVSLSATSTAPNASTCVNPNNPNNPCAMTFSDKGLDVKVPDHLSMAANNVAVTITALQAQNGNQSCVPLLANKKNVPIDVGCGFSIPTSSAASGLTLIDHSSAGVAVSCGNSPTTINLDFDANGKASAALTYAEVGKLSLTAKYTSNASPAFYAVGDTSFTVAPASITITAARVSSTTTLPTGVFARAGEPFKVSLTALNSKGNITKNFGSEDSANSKENFLVTKSITLPAAIYNPKGDIVKASDSGTKNGVSESIWSFTDVGSIKLRVGIDRPTGYYMDNQTTDFNPTAELDLGRFIPDHFDTTLPALVVPPATPAYSELPSTQLTGVTMKCANASSVNNPCTTSDLVNDRFIYSKQPFYLVVRAYNMQSALTQNYSTNFISASGTTIPGLAKTVNLSSWTAAGGTTAIGSMGWSKSSSPTRLSFVGGVGVVDAANLPYFDFGGTGPSKPTAIYVRATDTDNVTSGRATGAVEIPLTAVSGQMMVMNSYGSQSSNLPVSVQAQYYTAGNPGSYVLNPAYYSEPQAIGTNYTFDNCKGLNCAALALKTSALTFVAGKAGLLVAPPLAAGSANLTLKPGDWGNAYLPSTTGKEVFGIYRSGPVIYTREVHN